MRSLGTFPSCVIPKLLKQRKSSSQFYLPPQQPVAFVMTTAQEDDRSGLSAPLTRADILAVVQAVAEALKVQLKEQRPPPPPMETENQPIQEREPPLKPVSCCCST